MFLKLSGPEAYSYLGLAKQVLSQVRKYRNDNNLYSWKQTIQIPGGVISATVYGVNEVVDILVNVKNVFISTIFGDSTVDYSIKEFYTIDGSKIGKPPILIIDDGVYAPIDTTAKDNILEYTYSVNDISSNTKRIPAIGTGIDSKYILENLVRVVFNQAVEQEIFSLVNIRIGGINVLNILISDYNPLIFQPTLKNSINSPIGMYLDNGVYLLIPNISEPNPEVGMWFSKYDFCTSPTFTFDRLSLLKDVYFIKDRNTVNIIPIAQTSIPFINIKANSRGNYNIIKVEKDTLSFSDNSYPISGTYTFYNRYIDKNNNTYFRFSDQFKNNISSKYISPNDFSLIKEFPNEFIVPFKFNDVNAISKNSYIKYTKTFDESLLQLNYTYEVFFDGVSKIKSNTLEGIKVCDEATLDAYNFDKSYNYTVGALSFRYAFLKKEDICIDLHREYGGNIFYLGRKFNYIGSVLSDFNNMYYIILNSTPTQTAPYSFKCKIALYEVSWFLVVNGIPYDLEYKYTMAIYIPYPSFNILDSVSGKNEVLRWFQTVSFNSYTDGNYSANIQNYQSKQISRMFCSVSNDYSLVAFDVYPVFDNLPQIIYEPTYKILCFSHSNLTQANAPFVDTYFDLPIERKCFIFTKRGTKFTEFDLPKEYKRMNGISLIQV